MIIDNRQKDKILAAYFAATNLSDAAAVFEAFVHRMHREGKYDRLKHWWDDMNALRTIRAAEHHIRSLPPETEPSSDPIEKLGVGKNGRVQFMEEPIGAIYSYYRTVLPQETQIKIAYDSLIERFMGFLQRKKYAIRLSENQLAYVLFVPDIDFQLIDEWQRFLEFVYSAEELYKSFTLFVNNWRLSNRKGGILGYVRFPSVTEDMRRWQAAFYIATLRRRVLKPDKRGEPDTDNRRTKKREDMTQILSKLHEQLQHQDLKLSFDRAEKLSRQFNTLGSSQVRNAKAEQQIRDIMVEPLHILTCPIAPLDKIKRASTREAGDRIVGKRQTYCYGCGNSFSPNERKQNFKGNLSANSFVFYAPSQRLQSGTGEERPSVCPDCLTVAFASPIKLVTGTIIVQLSTDEDSHSLSIEKYLRMLTLGELNLIAGRYLLINCPEFIDKHGGLIFVSKEIGVKQYALWRIAQILPVEALNNMYFTLFVDESEIQLETRHIVWLSHLSESFLSRITLKDHKNKNRLNAPLNQAIRLIQKDEVISAIHRLATAKPTEAKQLGDWSYSEKRGLEELREKHCELLEKSSNGDKQMMKQAEFYRHVAALTGLTYAYCDYVRGELRGKENVDTVQREVKKLIEKVVNPSFFNYEAADVLPGTRATMYCNDDNYFCYAQAKRLLEDTLKLDLSDREGRTDKGQESLTIFFDDILNAYAAISQKYYKKAQQRKLSYQLKLNLHAKFASLFNQKGD
ncbi:hypothetical protein C6499_14620 [Candidatus Poribacteria bacterium]|nr:MAG: hypothetical protein C6499_14620 [Candidatus Poribacteria bacterium]